MKHKIKTVNTTPYSDQNAGTSGLRKKCRIFLQENYIENFIQSIFSSIPIEDRIKSSLVVGGDGRYFCREAIKKTIQIAAGNSFKKLIILKNGWGSTPAISHIIKKYKAIGGIILTASHNPGGVENDFGIKYNISTGGGATENDTKHIYQISKSIKTYNICTSIDMNIDNINKESFIIDKNDNHSHEIIIEIIDTCNDYVDYMMEIFNFPHLKQFISTGFDGETPLRLCIDGRNGIAGPYIKSIFIDHLGCDENSIYNFVPLEDFGNLHPDPNLIYAADFVEKMIDKDFGAAYDGDADRCMIIGNGKFFVSPSDSIAIIAANAVESIPYFSRKGKLNGVARSMPTSCALDQVAKLIQTTGNSMKCYEVPTGWKFFCNLLDAEKVDICGEESFGAGSCHLREKDGIWTSLAWLSIMALQKKPIKEIVIDHWKKFGRNYYTRYDYEDLTSEEGDKILKNMEELIGQLSSGMAIDELKEMNGPIIIGDNFIYHDPIDGSISLNQGYRLISEGGDRIIVRKSGTGSSGATIRIYVEHYENDQSKINMDANTVLKPLIDLALKITKIYEITKRHSPNVITN